VQDVPSVATDGVSRLGVPSITRVLAGEVESIAGREQTAGRRSVPGVVGRSREGDTAAQQREEEKGQHRQRLKRGMMASKKGSLRISSVSVACSSRVGRSSAGRLDDPLAVRSVLDLDGTSSALGVSRACTTQR
jgi:hypothetical protein